MLFFLISSLAGVLTVLAPCTLPLLPVIIGGSLDGGINRRKALTIVLSLGVSIILFTLLLKYSTVFISVPEYVWTLISGIIIIIFGLMSIFPGLWESLPGLSRLSTGSNELLSEGYKKKSFLGDIIIGASLGPVFSTCSPTYFVILATVLPRSFAEGFIDLIGYAVGLGVMLLLIAFVGQKIIKRLGGVSDTHGTFRKVLGVIFVFLGIAIVFGLDRQAEANILSSGFFDITRVEQKLLSLTEPHPGIVSNLNTILSTTTVTTTNGKPTYTGPHSTGPIAPEFVHPSGFINTDGKPITLAQYRGKIVLLDIWTYSCINCQRTLPYVKAWYEKYKSEGLVVIGIHTPEFSFEKVQSNVEDAVKRLGITYPVILDNDYATWNAYGNQYWPRKYLINADGQIIYDHIGEGGYDETEKEIQKALSELNDTIISTPITTPTGAIAVDPTQVASPETYFGSARNEYLGNGTQGLAGTQMLSFPKEMRANTLYLDGTWDFSSENAHTDGPAKIHFTYSAKNVYMVASSDAPAGATITIMEDGKKVNTLTIKDNKLYTLIQGSGYGQHDMEIIIDTPGINAFTFTFG